MNVFNDLVAQISYEKIFASGKNELAWYTASVYSEVQFWKEKTAMLQKQNLQSSLLLDIMDIPPWQVPLFDEDFLIWLKKCPDRNQIPNFQLFEYQKMWFWICSELEDKDHFMGQKTELKTVRKLKRFYDKLKK